MTPTAGIVIIGDEVLSAAVREVNSVFLCEELVKLGVAVRRVVMAPDLVEEIAADVSDCAARFDHVLTSGGVGPTHDDVTMQGVAAAFGRPLVRSAEAERIIRNFYGADMADAALRMADVPEGAELVMPEGMRFPVVRVENVWVFPGSPHLMRAKFNAIKDRFASTPFIMEQISVNAGEPEIAPFLESVQNDHPQVAIGSYPQEPGEPVQLILTIKGKDHSAVTRVVDCLRAGLAGKIAP
ncbi:MAG: competence/damage-inducible protein A [Nitrospirota bacterium]|nr:competence/damage-inducible protein A [Nitrospirota bacterium]